MRRAEIIVAFVLAVFSVYLMWKSTELPIGWKPGVGPGGGAFPFWLSLGMLITSGAVFVRGVLGITSEAQKTGEFVARAAQRQILIVSVSLAIMIGLIHIVGVYVSVPLFLLFYVRFLGKNSWKVTIPLVVLVPIFTFLFFERTLQIILPKGVTDEFFYIFF